MALLATLISSLSACSALGFGSGGDRLLVRLYDGRSKVLLQLSNESNPDLADIYSTEQPDASLKLAPDELLDELIADLDTLNFQTLSTPGAPPASGVRGWIEVRRNGSGRTFAVPTVGPTADQLSAFVYMKLTVNEYYSHIGSAQFIENPEGGALLKKQQLRGAP